MKIDFIKHNGVIFAMASSIVAWLYTKGYTELANELDQKIEAVSNDFDEIDDARK